MTYVRLLEKAIEEFYYARATNRIRSYYLELAGADARYFLLKGHDDARGVFENRGLSSSRVQLVFTSANTIAIVNSVVAGAGTALLVGAPRTRRPASQWECATAATVALAIAHLSTSDEASKSVRFYGGPVPVKCRTLSDSNSKGEPIWNPRTSCPSRRCSRW